MNVRRVRRGRVGGATRLKVNNHGGLMGVRRVRRGLSNIIYTRARAHINNCITPTHPTHVVKLLNIKTKTRVGGSTRPLRTLRVTKSQDFSRLTA